ncbi:MAG: FKBP-type peptidyl-prolyl cis-trans isomerase [Myxococcota bacterium]
MDASLPPRCALLPDRPRDQVALVIAVVAILVILVTIRGPLRPPLVTEPEPFEVQASVPTDADVSTLERRKPSRAIPEVPRAVPADAWIDLESGLDVYDATPGDGARIFRGEVVLVDYTIWLEDGTLAYSTLEKAEPARYVDGLGGVLPGIAEGVRPMTVGGKRSLRVPPELGYRNRGRGLIPPDATLQVDVELVDVLRPRTAPPADLDLQAVARGLEVAVLADGEGPALEAGDRAVMDYAMWVEGGEPKPIDQSFERVEPFSVDIGRRKLLAGWDQGLRGMRPGGHRVLRLAPEVAFGPQGREGIVPPNATILVEVRLHRIRKALRRR